MSAFVLETKIIRRIVTYLNRHHRDFVHITNELGYDLQEFKDLKRLTNDLHAMNCAAVSDRYSEACEPVEVDFDYYFGDTSQFQVLKSMECLLYNCAEGEVTEKPLFKGLERMISALRHDIISNLMGYKLASWAD